MCANDSAVDDRRRLINVYLKLAEDLAPDVLLRPVAEPVVDGFPIAEPLWQISPLDAGLRAEDDGIDEQTITSRRLTTLWAARQQRLQASPLLVRESVALHEPL